MGQKWIVDSGATNHIAWNKKCFNINFYKNYDVDQTMQGTSKTFAAISVDSIKITIQAPRGHYHDITLLGVLHYPILFTNLLSVSYLQKKGWYLYGGTKTLNKCDDNFKLESTPIYNSLYILQTH